MGHFEPLKRSFETSRNLQKPVNEVPKQGGNPVDGVHSGTL